MDQTQDPTLSDLLKLLRNGLVPALIVGATLGAVAFWLSQRQPPTYEASSLVLATQPDREVQGIDVALPTAPRVDASAYDAAATSGPVLADARQRLEDPERFRQVDLSVSIDQSQYSSLLTITANAGDPMLASAAANATAEALVAWDEHRAARIVDRSIVRLESQVAALDEQIATLGALETETSQDQRDELLAIRAQRRSELFQARTLRNSAIGSLEVLEPASVPNAPVAPRPSLMAAIAFVMGVGLSYAFMLLRNASTMRARSGIDLERITGLPILAALPDDPRRSTVASREAISYLHTNLEFALSREYPAAVAVTSPELEKTHSGVSVGLATSFAAAGHRVLLIDADPAKAQLTTQLIKGEATTPSFQHHLLDRDVHFDPTTVRTGGVEFGFIPTLTHLEGQDNLLRTGLQRCMNRWRHQYDLIIFDAPPVLSRAQGLIMSTACDLTLLCVDVKRESPRKVTSAVTLLKRTGTPVGMTAINLGNFDVDASFSSSSKQWDTPVAERQVQLGSTD